MSVFLLVIVLYFLFFTVNVMSVVFKIICSVGGNNFKGPMMKHNSSNNSVQFEIYAF